jgi:uncharacterized protein YndB with AHSA1/START domain
MDFEFTIVINKPHNQVFDFFKDIDQHAGRKGSLVPVYDRITPGPVEVGTRYYEVVRLFPYVYGKVLTEVIGYEPDHRLAYRFIAMGMGGKLTYWFESVEGGTQVVQQQSLHPRGFMKLVSPLIASLFSRMAGKRLLVIKNFLESSDNS